jgi:hypothetical protein
MRRRDGRKPLVVFRDHPNRLRSQLSHATIRGAMDTQLFHGLFRWHLQDGQVTLTRHESAPASIPCPHTGRALRIATIDAQTPAICPRCSGHGRGAFVSFVGDLRMAYACPACCELVWLAGV